MPYASAPKSSLEAVNKILEAVQSMLPDLDQEVRDAILEQASLCESLNDFSAGLDAIKPGLSERFNARLVELS